MFTADKILYTNQRTSDLELHTNAFIAFIPKVLLNPAGIRRTPANKIPKLLFMVVGALY